jgi:hypothetical protein
MDKMRTSYKGVIPSVIAVAPFEPALALLMPHSALNGRRDQAHH